MPANVTKQPGADATIDDVIASLKGSLATAVADDAPAPDETPPPKLTLEQLGQAMLAEAAPSKFVPSGFSAFVVLITAEQTLATWNTAHNPSATVLPVMTKHVLPVITEQVNRIGWSDFPEASMERGRAYDVARAMKWLAIPQNVTAFVLVTDGQHHDVETYLRRAGRGENITAAELKEESLRGWAQVGTPPDRVASLPAAVLPAAVAAAPVVEAGPVKPALPEPPAEEPDEIVTSWETRPKRRSPIRADRPASASARKRGRPAKPKG